jgi:hypothetical protein
MLISRIRDRTNIHGAVNMGREGLGLGVEMESSINVVAGAIKTEIVDDGAVVDAD